MFIDIGQKTIEHYLKIIQGAGTFFVSGPVRGYKKDKFEEGTKRIFNFAGTPHL